MCRCFFPQKIIRFAAGLFGRSEYFVFSFLGTGYIATRNIVLRFKIDDPIEAISVHAFGGVLSLFLSPILSEKYGMIYLATADRSLQYSSGDHGFGLFRRYLPFYKKNTNHDFFGKGNVLFFD